MNNAVQKRLSEFLHDKVVLVVEPSVNYRTSIKQFLANLRVNRIKLVSSVQEARRELLTARVGLFIVEWSMEGENGLQFCRSLRKEPSYKDTAFMLLSTENLRKDVILASELKIHSYLLKPFSYEEFCYQLASIIKLQQSPTRLAQILDLAHEQLEKGDLNLSENLFNEALSIQAKSAKALVGLALVEQKKKNSMGALRYLNQATQANPEYIEAFRMMLDVLEERKDRAGMLQTAIILHEMSPENPRYTLVLARCYLEISALEASEKFFKKTVQLSPRLADGYKGLGYVYLAQDEYEKARKHFSKAIDLDTKDASTLNALGTSYIRLGQFQEGIARYMMALKFVPHDPRILFNIGHAHEKNSDLEKAKWYYAQSLLHKPNFEKPKRGLERLEGSRPDSSTEEPDLAINLDRMEIEENPPKKQSA
jgi:Tfp pilus assembly protein PilF